MSPPSLWRLCSSRSARSGRPVLAWGGEEPLGLAQTHLEAGEEDGKPELGGLWPAIAKRGRRGLSVARAGHSSLP